MTSAYFASLVLLPTVVTEPGQYRTRGGEVVTVNTVSMRHNFGCSGVYADGTRERWHKSGRIYATRECRNDIVGTL